MDAEGALRDIIEGMRLAPLWLRLGWEQTVARFRRTIFGPFWLSANLLAISFALAVVFGAMMGTSYRATFPILIGGVLTWTLIGGVMSDAAGVFISSGPWMQTMRMPLTFYIMLMMTKNVINFLCQLIAFWVVLALLQLGSIPTWQLLVGLPLLIANMSLLSMILAMPSTRFRDINQTVGFAVQLLFFLTPVFWAPSQMHGRASILYQFNPFAHLLELVRQPLLGAAPALVHYEWGFGIFALLLTIAFLMLAAFRKRVVFWL